MSGDVLYVAFPRSKIRVMTAARVVSGEILDIFLPVPIISWFSVTSNDTALNPFCSLAKQRYKHALLERLVGRI